MSHLTPAERYYEIHMMFKNFIDKIIIVHPDYSKYLVIDSKIMFTGSNITIQTKEHMYRWEYHGITRRRRTPDNKWTQSSHIFNGPGFILITSEEMSLESYNEAYKVFNELFQIYFAALCCMRLSNKQKI